MERIVLALLLVTSFSISSSSPVYYQPEQVHIAYGENETLMYVVWSTQTDTSSSVVLYSLAGSSQQLIAKGNSTTFEDGGSQHRVQYIHRVILTNLEPGQKYTYTCGSDYGWSEQYSFTAMQNGTNWSPRLAVYGDLGNVNAQSLPRLQLEAEKGMYDAILHVGDFAYDMDTNDALVGDEFMRQIEPIAAILPYMTCPGNHEANYNFSNYKNRFAMPGDSYMDKMFFSFNIGPAHIISLSTEYYFFTQYGNTQAAVQYTWIENDLKEATKPENRAQRPWIITMGHRPMYCSNSDNDDCTRTGSYVRTGGPFSMSLETLFYNYGVDVMIWAHEHSYERMWPVYNEKVYNGSLQEPYTNPKAPVHVVTGSAGCQENHDNFISNFAAWSAFHSDDYGYTRMTIYNATHLYMEQVSDDQGGKIIDSFMLKKDSHGPYGLKSKV